jgi:hypothetical protein
LPGEDRHPQRHSSRRRSASPMWRVAGNWLRVRNQRDSSKIHCSRGTTSIFSFKTYLNLPG